MRAAGILLVWAAMLVASPPADAQGLFSPESFRNTPLPPDAPLDVLSGPYVDNLAGKVEGYGAHVNHGAYSTPVYTVTPRHKPRQVFVTGPGHRDCSNGSPALSRLCSGPVQLKT